LWLCLSWWCVCFMLEANPGPWKVPGNPIFIGRT
jgi:hypothetical protein